MSFKFPNKLDIESKVDRLFEIYTARSNFNENLESQRIDIPTKLLKFGQNSSYKIPDYVPIHKIKPPASSEFSENLKSFEKTSSFTEESKIIPETDLKGPLKKFGIELPDISDDSENDDEIFSQAEPDVIKPVPPPPPLPVTPVPILSQKIIKKDAENSASTGRENLLDSIRKLGGFQGAKLKSAQTELVDHEDAGKPEVDLISALSRQLADRRLSIQPGLESGKIRLPSQSSDSDSNWD